MDLHQVLRTTLLLLLLNYASCAATSLEGDNFLKTCSSHRCSKHHGPEIRFPFRLSTHPPACGAPGMQLSCLGHDTILDHPVLGTCKVTAIYYTHRVMNVIPLAGSSPQCPLQKLVSRNQSTDVYTSVAHSYPDSVLVGCSRVATNQDHIVGPSSCLSLSSNAKPVLVPSSSSNRYIYSSHGLCGGYKGHPNTLHLWKKGSKVWKKGSKVGLVRGVWLVQGVTLQRKGKQSNQIWWNSTQLAA